MSRSIYRSRASLTRRRRMTLALQLEAASKASLEQCNPDPLPKVFRDQVIPPVPRGNRNPPIESIEAFQEFLARQNSVTWLLTGDSLAGDTTEGGIHLANLLPGLIRNQNRQHDVFIVTDRRNDLLENLVRDLDDRVLRFAPQVVILTIGPAEILNQRNSLLELESLFHEAIQRMQDCGITVIVNLPPCFSLRDEPDAVNHLIRLEGIRSCSKELGVLLIDHWSAWEREHKSDWYCADRIHPSDQGILEISQQIMREMGLYRDFPVAAAKSEANGPPVE